MATAEATRPQKKNSKPQTPRRIEVPMPEGFALEESKPKSVMVKILTTRDRVMELRRLGIKWQRDWDTGHANFWAKHGDRSNLKPR